MYVNDSRRDCQPQSGIQTFLGAEKGYESHSRNIPFDLLAHATAAIGSFDREGVPSLCRRVLRAETERCACETESGYRIIFDGELIRVRESCDPGSGETQ